MALAQSLPEVDESSPPLWTAPDPFSAFTQRRITVTMEMQLTRTCGNPSLGERDRFDRGQECKNRGARGSERGRGKPGRRRTRRGKTPAPYLSLPDSTRRKRVDRTGRAGRPDARRPSERKGKGAGPTGCRASQRPAHHRRLLQPAPALPADGPTPGRRAGPARLGRAGHPGGRLRRMARRRVEGAGQTAGVEAGADLPGRLPFYPGAKRCERCRTVSSQPWSASARSTPARSLPSSRTAMSCAPAWPTIWARRSISSSVSRSARHRSASSPSIVLGQASWP